MSPFITLEGGEGVGKSTLAKRLAVALEANGHRVKLTREPGGTPAAEQIREMLLAAVPPLEPLSEVLLFNAARVEHLRQVIGPSRRSGMWVICDRFMDSTRAYQLAADPGLRSTVDTLERICVGSERPDLTIILDLPVEASRRRLEIRGATPDAIEARDAGFHNRVRSEFLDIARNAPERCVVIDATAGADDVASQALSLIANRFPGGST